MLRQSSGRSVSHLSTALRFSGPGTLPQRRPSRRRLLHPLVERVELPVPLRDLRVGVQDDLVASWSAEVRPLDFEVVRDFVYRLAPLPLGWERLDQRVLHPVPGASDPHAPVHSWPSAVAVRVFPVRVGRLPVGGFQSFHGCVEGHAFILATHSESPCVQGPPARVRRTLRDAYDAARGAFGPTVVEACRGGCSRPSFGCCSRCSIPACRVRTV